MDFQESVNNQSGHKVGITSREGGQRGDIDLPLRVGGVRSSRAVPGAKIQHLEKMYTQERFFVRLFSPNVSCCKETITL